MEDPGAYDTNTANLQRSIAQELIPEIVAKMSWKEDEVIMDFGCGPGFVTKNIMKPLVDERSSNSTIYGVDICPDMIAFASSKYTSPNIIYKAANILEANDLRIGSFDKIFSSLVLHRILDQKEVFQRIYDLLKPGGAIGIFYMASHPFLTVVERMIANPKWVQYLGETSNIDVPLTQNDPFTVQTTRGALEEIGYFVEECTGLVRKHISESFEKIADFYISRDRNIPLIPVEVLDEYKADFRTELRKVVRDSPTETFATGVEMEYTLMVIRARKRACCNN